MKKRIIKNKLLFKLIIITIIAFIIGILFIAILSKSNKEMIKDNLETYFNSIKKLNYTKGIINSITNNYICIITIWILGLSIIGIPIIILILIYKSFILGFSLSSIIYFYNFKGILLALIYIIPLAINLLLIFILCYYAVIVSINLNRLLFLKKHIDYRNIMRKYTKIFIFIITLVTISSFIEIYLIPSVFKLLQI